MSRQFDDLKLGSIELFCLTAELQGFTRAAIAAGLTPAAVSRAVGRLEARLGVQLFVRTTRSVRLTEGGRRYFEQCRQAIGQLVEAEREVTGQQASPSGTVRISLPTSYGHYRVLPLLPLFREQHPEVLIDVQLSNRNVDFASEDCDLAVRARPPVDSSLVVRPLAAAQLVVVATPRYLRKHGTPRSPADLDQHECLQFLLPRNGQPIPWLLRQDGQDIEWPIRGSIRCSDDILGPVSLARAGAGVVQTFRFVVETELREGVLKEVLQRHGGATRQFSLLYPANRHMPQRVRVLVDFLMQRLGPGSGS
jgi:DNA-binding transcriptional LysR family regulator